MKITFDCRECFCEITAKIIGIFLNSVCIEETVCPNHCGMTYYMVEIEEIEKYEQSRSNSTA